MFTRTRENPWLALFAGVTALATLGLIMIGGLVTSHGAGMAVPDWPTTYGYNMFLFPISHWVGGILYEHTHRLVASGVGLLTTILAVWLWVKEERRWLRWLGVVAFVAVVLQGVLGGLRVTLYKQELGIFHATIAQLFLLLVASIAFFLSGLWRKLQGFRRQVLFPLILRPLVLGATILILLQLILGATMRHQHAGLAVPDFPLAYGELYPPTNAEFVREVNARRLDVREFSPITAVQIHLHMAHRATAVLILLAVGGCAWVARQSSLPLAFKRFAYGWLGLILAQAALGAWTVWSNKAADVATAHVLGGALSLVCGGLFFLVLQRIYEPAARRVEVVEPASLPRGSGAFA